MADSKCKNCGANIPKDASFCPECGKPKIAEKASNQIQQKNTQKTQQPQQIVQPATDTQASMENLSKQLFSKYMIMLGFCIGVLLIWIGVILRNFAGSIGSSINGVLTPTSFAGIGLLVFGGGFLNKNIDKYVRMGMIIIGGLIIIFGLAGLNFGVNIPINI